MKAAPAAETALSFISIDFDGTSSIFILPESSLLEPKKRLNLSTDVNRSCCPPTWCVFNAVNDNPPAPSPLYRLWRRGGCAGVAHSAPALSSFIPYSSKIAAEEKSFTTTTKSHPQHKHQFCKCSSFLYPAPKSASTTTAPILNPEESKRFRWCVRSEDQKEGQERNQTMLLQRAQTQSCHSSTKMQQETTKKIYTKTRERCAATTTQTKKIVQTTKSVASSKNGGCCWSHPPQHILQSTCAHVHALGFDVVKAPGKPKRNTPHELLYVSLASFVQI